MKTKSKYEMEKQVGQSDVFTKDLSLSNVELNQFMLYNLNEIINYFNESRKGDINESKRNSKRYLAKQGK